MVGRRRAAGAVGRRPEVRVARTWSRVSRGTRAWSRTGRGESAIVSSGRIVSAASALVVAIASARTLGPAGRGEVVLVVTICILAMGLVDLGVNTSARIRILRNVGSSIEDFLGISVVLTVVQAVVVGGVLLAPRITGGGLQADTIAVGVVLGAAMFFAHMLVDACFAVRASRQVIARDLIAGGLPMVVVGVAAGLGRLSVEGVLGVMALGYVGGACWLWVVVRRRAGSPRFRTREWIPMVRAGLPVLGGTFTEAVAYRADRLIMGVVTTASALGVYSVAATAVELPRLLLIPATQILSNRVATGQVGDGRVFVAGYWLLLTVIAVTGGPVILAVVGDGFEGIESPLRILSLSEALFGVYLVAIAVLTGRGAFRKLLAPGIAGAAIVVVGGSLLVSGTGMVGTAWIRVVAFGAMAISAVAGLRVSPEGRGR